MRIQSGVYEYPRRSRDFSVVIDSILVTAQRALPNALLFLLLSITWALVFQLALR